MTQMTRVMVATAGTTPKDIRDVIVVDNQAQLYESVHPWQDLGVGTGAFNIDNELRILTLEMRELHDADLLVAGGFALAVLYQDNSQVIHCETFPIVRRTEIVLKKSMSNTTYPLVLQILSDSVSL